MADGTCPDERVSSGESASPVFVAMPVELAEFFLRYACCQAPAICGATCQDTDEAARLAELGWRCKRALASQTTGRGHSA